MRTNLLLLTAALSAGVLLSQCSSAAIAACTTDDLLAPECFPSDRNLSPEGAIMQHCVAAMGMMNSLAGPMDCGGKATEQGLQICMSLRKAWFDRQWSKARCDAAVEGLRASRAGKD